ncbi:MAG TPA: TatD family hydrolase [Myxococcota bacterium]|nr:TatD family hydrolase [Myxococcota bacterium]HRY96351.1 TatD family hydrolase [Myxococcota bacterium]
MSPAPGAGLIDSHAHLDFESFQADLPAVLERAWEAGLTHIVAIGAGQGSEGAHQAVALAARDERLSATAGVHPHDAALGLAWGEDAGAPVPAALRAAWEARAETCLERMHSLALHPQVVAIGEVGLDHHYDHAPRELQRELFRRFVRLARRVGKPLVIHVREAEAEAAGILEEEGAAEVGGVIHCFGGQPALERAGLALGFFFGLTGILTFPRAHELQRTAATLPLERLLLETDSPYLAPVPHRGRRCEPALVVETARALARLRALPLEEVVQRTAENTRRLFRLDGRARLDGRVAYRLGDGLYLNLTNRCTLACRFCLKRGGASLGDIPLGLRREPAPDEVRAAVEAELARGPVAEVVFCGLGEPLLRLEAVRELGRWLRGRGLRVRVNTDGLASLVHGRDVVPELLGSADALSVSLNAPDATSHARLCPSVYGPAAFPAVCAFIRRAAELLPEVTASVVRCTGVDLEASAALARSLGARFRVRG